MSVSFRNYRNDERFGADYHNVCNFLIRINKSKVIRPNFLWGRWVWMISRPVDYEERRNKIGLWQDNGRIVALATFELSFGEVFICIDNDYRFLLPEIINYAEQNLAERSLLKISISDDDREFQKIAQRFGYVPLQEKEFVSVMDFHGNMEYNLPAGFKTTSMEGGWDFYQYNRVMWRGFGHEGEPPQEEEDINWRKTMLSSPHLVPELLIAITEPKGNYVSHCGLWYVPGSSYAYVEPVASDPVYRKIGLAKASLFEAVNRAGKMGATSIYVCSSQQFYYNLGFYPVTPETWWEKTL